MKLKRKILQWGLVVVAGVAALTSLTSIYSLINSPDVLAAASSIPIINDQGTGAACVANVHQPTDFSTVISKLDGAAAPSQTWASTWYAPDNASNPGGVDINAVKAVVEQQSAAYIDFSGVNPQYNAECGVTMLLAQSPSSPDNFYGIWIDHKDSQVILQQASVNPAAKTITLTLHPKSGGTSYTANLGDPNAILGGPLFDGSLGSGGGGGSASTNDGSCVVTVATDADLKKCIDTAATSFLFENAATIQFGDDTYLATNWGKSGGGNTDEIQYMLQPGGFEGHTSGKTSEIDLSTKTYDINLDNLDSGNIQSFFSSLQKAASDGTVSVTFHNYNKEGNPSTYNNLKVASTNISIFAQYYPASDQVSTIFQSGGDNEKYEIGTYGPGTTLKYSKQSPTVPEGCTAKAATPYFTFQSDPKQAQTGSIITATWTMFDTHCNSNSRDIKIQVQAADATVPVTVNDSNPNGSTGAPTCESTGFSLSWIMCPIINGLANAVDGIYGNIIQPLLKTDPVDFSGKNNDATHTYAIWSQFRVYGDIFLVIALLVIVFGQSIGGGLIDAYAAKKILPRLLIAAVLINLSIYIVALLVDVTNILGNGLNSLISAPFTSTGNYHISLSGGASGIGLATLVGGTGVAIWSAVAGGLALWGPLLLFLLLFVLIPTFLIFVAIMVTVLVRRGLIILLILLSPVAFALYCLPNTEKYFKKWWDLLFETLMVYPIIAVLFAVSNVLAVTLGDASKTSFPMAGLGSLMSIIALVVPLFLIPFSFRIAGGVIGKLHETLNNYGKRSHQALLGSVNNPMSLRNKTKRRVGEGFTRSRERSVDQLSSWQKRSNSGALRRGIGVMGWAMNMGDLEAKRSMLTKEESERRELKTGYGPDSSVRAFFAEKRPDGKWYSRTTGQQFSAIEVAKANSLYGHGVSSVQSAIDYELGKAEPAQYNQMVDDTSALLESKGYTQTEINGIMKGVGFKNQAKYLDLKHSSFKKGADGKWTHSVNHAALSQNAAVDFGSYPISNMKPEPIKRLAEAHAAAEAALEDGNFEAHGFKASEDGHFTARQMAERTRQDVESTAATLDTSWRAQGGGAAGQRVVAEGAEGQPLTAAGPSSGAPGRVDVEIQKLVRQVNESKARRGGEYPQERPQSPQGGGGIIIPPPGYTGSQE